MSINNTGRNHDSLSPTNWQPTSRDFRTPAATGHQGGMLELHRMRVEELERENEALRAACTTAYATLERDGDEWGICDQLRHAIAAKGKS